MEVSIDDEFRALIPPPTAEERAELEQLLLDAGRARDPLVAWRGLLLDGHNRHEICTAHGLSYTVEEVELPDRDAAKLWIIRNQLGRRNLSSFQRIELALAMEPLLRKLAKGNQKAAGGDRKSESAKSVPQNSVKAIDTDRELATAAGVSHDTIRKARVIAEQGSPDVLTQLRTGRTTTVNREYKKIAHAERKTAQLASIEATPLPIGKYRVIVIDPPWQYEKRVGDVTHRADLPYPSMATDEICKLPIADLTHDDAIVWLWTTNAHMEESYRVAAAWGLQVKTTLTWFKDRMGCGDWLRGQTEHCLMCIKGHPVVNLTDESTALFGAARVHSQKPEEFYELVRSLCPGNRLEMFSRQQHEGFECWGAEAGSIVPIPAPVKHKRVFAGQIEDLIEEMRRLLDFPSYLISTGELKVAVAKLTPLWADFRAGLGSKRNVAKLSLAPTQESDTAAMDPAA